MLREKVLYSGPTDTQIEGVSLTEKIKHRILIADDEDDLRTLLGDLLSGADYDVIYASDGEEAISQIRSHKPDLALLDIQMPRANGIEVLKDIDQNCPSLHVILLTAFAVRKYALEAREFGARDF